MGNQVIFDDVFPKMLDLLRRGRLTGRAAADWDAETLSNEQQLVQSMYAGTSQTTLTEFEGYARQRGFLPWLAGVSGFTQPHRTGGFHREGAVPGFTGDIMSPNDRFRYGMRLADQFSTHPAPASPVARPAPGADYTSGARFRALDVRHNLHTLDAELDDFDVDEEVVIRIMQRLTPDEQRELGFNRQRLDFMRNALNADEMRRALAGRTHIPQDVRTYLTQ